MIPTRVCSGRPSPPTLNAGRPAGPERAFTLVELLVVISIIATLAALVSFSVTAVRRNATKKECELEVQRISAGLESYLSDRGDYPPSDLESFYAVTTNGINDGIESLVAHLASTRRAGPYYEFKEESLENLDGDSLLDDALFEELAWTFGDRQLRELVDPWGNPFIYIQNRNYEDGPYRIQNSEGQEMAVSAARSEKLQTFHSLNTFQLWSMGPDGVNQSGGGDDIGSW